ncbi:MAG TPA: oligosaccharide flippase family protein [Pyrinomonadaceae bacterium]|nr:oligosaccharide flippase family protein [Pyrinomonadaceae bacterium]
MTASEMVVRDSVDAYIGPEVPQQGLSLSGRAAWLMSAKALAFVFSFALPLLLARRMNTTEYGTYKQFSLIVGTSLALLPLGVGVSALYFLSREDERKRQIAYNILLFHFSVAGVACLVFILRPTLLGRVFGNAEMTTYAPLIGVVVLLWVGSAFLEFVAIANREVKLATLFVILTQFSKAVCLLAAGIIYGTVLSLIYAAILHGLLQTALLLFYLHSRFAGFWRSFEWAVMRTQLAYALPLGFASLIFQTQLILDNYFVSFQFGAAAYAIYANGCFQVPLVDLLSESVASVTIPRASYLQKLGRQREIIELISRMMRKLSAIYFPLYVFLLVSGREFILTLFTARYLASWPIFAVNITLIPLALIASAYDPVMRAYAQHRYFLLRVRLIMLALLFVSLWFATNHFGMIGAITTMVVINCLERLITGIKVKRILGITRKDLGLFKDMGKLGIASIIAGAATWVARSFMLGVKPFFALAGCAVLFAMTYIAATLLLGVVTQDERNLARRKTAQTWQRAVQLLSRGAATVI